MMIMKTSVCVLALLALGATAGCHTAAPEPSSGPVSAPTAKPASRILGPSGGDVSAKGIYAQKLSTEIWRELVTVSSPATPRDVIGQMATEIEETTHTDAMHLVARGGPASVQIPVDSTEGEAYLFLGPQVDGTDAIHAALREIELLDPAGQILNARVPKDGATRDPLPMTMIPLAGHAPGFYTARFKSGAPSQAMTLDVRMPRSTIAMRLKPSTAQHLLGNESSIDVTLTDGAAAIRGARITARLVLPNHDSGATLVFNEVGDGVYRASLSKPLGSADVTGAYLADIRAEGLTAAGTPFARHGRTGFHYGIPSARVLDITDTRTIKDAAGVIQAFEVDVRLEAASLDRLEVSAKLAMMGADGLEHPVAIAHTGAGFDAGTHTATLRFDASHARLAKADGELFVRDLQMFSLGTNTLFHRELAGKNKSFPTIVRAQLARVGEVSPAIQQLIADGVLDPQ
jgi:hypothetical protein